MQPPETLAAPAQDRIGAGIEYACGVLLQADRIVQITTRQPGLRYAEHVGPHLRHIVEHFTEFLRGLDTGVIDYDRRARERALEREPLLMRSRLAVLMADLRASRHSAWPAAVVVAAEGGLNGEENFCCDSTPLRELLFLASHATHHFALLKLLLEAHGVKLAEDFGKAPATIRFERAGAASRAA